MDIQEIISRNFPVISDEYKAFAEEKSKCQECRIFKDYENVVMSEGNAKNPTFMFVGECPGKCESEQNRPFIGMAGQMLRKELRKHGSTFKRDTVLTSNVLPCRPFNNEFPDDNDDFHIVSNCLEQWLKREIEILRPKVIVLLGNKALQWITGKTGITVNRGSWNFLSHLKYPVWSFSTFHPSYVVRSEKSGNRYIVQQFENDIAKIANMWESIVFKDFRMSMNNNTWKKNKAFNTAKNMGLLNN